MRHCVNERADNWDLKLPLVELAYNDTVNASTGYTPFYLNHGRHPRMPWFVENATTPGSCEHADAFVSRMRQTLLSVRQNLTQDHERQARAADRFRRDHTFHEGDVVWLSAGNFKLLKLGPRFLGPFPIIKVVSPVVMRLELPAALRHRHPTFHVSQLRPFVASPTRFAEPRATPAIPILLDNTDERYYTVEALRASRRVRIGAKRRCTNQYLVKWTGYSESENTWEDATKLREDVPSMIEEFLAAQK